MDYSNWLRRDFPNLNNSSKEALDSFVDRAISDTQLFREFLKVLGALFFIIPFNLFLYISTIQSYGSFLYWFLVIVSIGVGSFIGLYCEQRLIKMRLKKIVQLEYTQEAN